CQQLVEYPYTF
nr:immunoglobulin light chain junction region [Mus musculus]